MYFMNLKFYTHRLDTIDADILKEIDLVFDSLKSISSENIIDRFINSSKSTKSLSFAIKDEINKIVLELGYHPDKNIFKNSKYSDAKRFTYDYFKNSVNIEFGFNHEMASAWKLIKGSLNSSKAILKDSNSNCSIIITVTKAMRDKGGFDGSIATFEKYMDYLEPMYGNVMNPIILVGIEPFANFEIVHKKYYNKTIGQVIYKNGRGK